MTSESVVPRNMRVFLSHASADKPLATQVYRALRDQAVDVWFDRVELRAGDSLLAKIAEGIDKAACLLVLVTDNSKRSAWVTKELTIALTAEVNGTGPRVVPLLVEGCEVPTLLADKIFVPIDSRGGGIDNILPALFRESYMVDILLKPDDFSCDEPALQEALYEYMRSDLRDLHVRIGNRGFNGKVLDTASQSAACSNECAPLAKQITENSLSLAIELPVYWANLAALLCALIRATFEHYGNNMNAVGTATAAVARSLGFAHFTLFSRLHASIFPSFARQFGNGDLAAFMERFEGISVAEPGEELVRQMCRLPDAVQLADIGIRAKPDSQLVDSRAWIPIFSGDQWTLQATCAPSELITDLDWFQICVPQMLARHLSAATFHGGRPIHELGYRMSFLLQDYVRIGLS